MFASLGQPFGLFFAAHTVSNVGDTFRRLALTLWVFQVSGASGLAVAFLTFLEIVPTLLLSPLAGVVVDRLDRRRLLLWCDAGRATLSAGLVLAALTHNLALGFVLLVLSTLFSVFADLAANTAVPSLVTDSSLERAYALMSVSQQLSFVLGPLLAAVSFAHLGPGLAFSLDAASFVASFLLLRLLPKAALAPVHTQGSRLNFWREVREGAMFVRTSRLVTSNFVVTGLRVLSSGINNTAMLFFLTRDLGRPATDVAWLSTSNGVMQVLIGGALVAASHRVPLRTSLVGGLACMALGGVLVAVAPSLVVLTVGVVVTSLGNAPVNVATTTLEGRFVPTALLGRVRAWGDILTTVLFLSASGGTGLLIDEVGARTWLVASAVLMLGAFLVAWWVLRPLLAVNRATSAAGSTDDVPHARQAAPGNSPHGHSRATRAHD